MRRVQAGETRALELLVQRWTPRLASFFYRLTGDPHAADDLMQETFVRVWTARASFQPGARFSPWIHAIARNLATDRSRNRERKPLHRAAAAGAGNATTL